MGDIALINMELAPTSSTTATEDGRLLPIYIQILDLDFARKCWKETTRKGLATDPNENNEAARRLGDSYLTRAKWIYEIGIETILFL